MSKQSEPKQVVIDLSGRYFFNKYSNYLIKSVLNVFLMLFLFTYIEMAVYDNIEIIVLFSGIFTLVEEVLAYYMRTHFARYIFMSFGTLLILPIIVAMSVSYFVLTSSIMFRSMDTFFGFIVVFMIIRKFISVLLTAYLNRRRFEKLIEKEVNKDV